MIGGDEISPWIPENGHIELLETVDYVYPETIFVDQAVFVVGVIDASIDTSAHVSRYRQKNPASAAVSL